MSKADIIYNNVLRNILSNGVWDKDQSVRTTWADGSSAHTKSIICQQMHFDNTEVPILTTKKVAWKTAIKELLWIWQLKSNDVRYLREKMGVNIWNEWEKEDGTIGTAYGYQMDKRVRKLSMDEYSRIRELSDIAHFVSTDKDYVLVDQVDYLIHQLKYNPASRRHITSLWNIDDMDSMALNPCVWHTQWLVKEGRLHLIVGIR